MKQKLFIDLLKVVGGFLILWAAFYYIPWFPDEETFDYPISAEVELGEVIVEELILSDGSNQQIQSAYVDSCIYVIADRLLDSLPNSEYEYTFYVLASDEINAFALPGGNIVVYAGLIDFAENAEELAAVLAHEIGHVESRHVMKRLMKEFGIQVLMGSFGADGVVLSEVSQSAASTYFDRKQESEADEFAMDLLQKTNTNPRYLGTFFRRLKRKHGLQSDFDFFSTHPNVTERIRKSVEFEPDSATTYLPYAMHWSALQDSVQVNRN